MNPDSGCTLPAMPDRRINGAPPNASRGGSTEHRDRRQRSAQCGFVTFLYVSSQSPAATAFCCRRAERGERFGLVSRRWTLRSASLRGWRATSRLAGTGVAASAASFGFRAVTRIAGCCSRRQRLDIDGTGASAISCRARSSPRQVLSRAGRRVSLSRIAVSSCVRFAVRSASAAVSSRTFFVRGERRVGHVGAFLDVARRSTLAAASRASVSARRQARQRRFGVGRLLAFALDVGAELD